MSLPTAAELDLVIEATWPAASHRTVGPFTLRDGQGGGQRASSATADGPVTRADIDAAARTMAEMDQRPDISAAPRRRYAGRGTCRCGICDPRPDQHSRRADRSDRGA